MSIRRIIIPAAIFVALISLLFIYPSIDRPIGAEQSLYTGHEDHNITLQEGVELTKAYRLTSKGDVPLAQYFGKDALANVLAQPGCVGLRLYYGKHADGSSAIVIVGVDSKGKDMTKGLICQRSRPCPPYCDEVNSELKQDNTFATLK
jgi:hypothetical protein